MAQQLGDSTHRIPSVTHTINKVPLPLTNLLTLCKSQLCTSNTNDNISKDRLVILVNQQP